MFTEKLKTARRKSGLTQQKAAELLNLSTRSYQRYEAENGYCDPPLNTLVEMANLFDVSIDWLLDRDEWLKSHAISFEEY